jgi:hypothetical protein
VKLRRICLLLLAAMFLSTTGNAQTNYPPETRNAALRYWLAFADLQDPSADKPTQELLEKVAAGEAGWDEARLGSILDQNEAAILAMQRATRLPDCDWGLEYSAGVGASIAYSPRARVLARLNTAYGMRVASKGDLGRAVDTWLAGIHFSRDLSKGGPVIFSLIARSTLLPNLRALTGAARSGSLSSAQQKQIAAAVGALPETAFDWGQAMRLEEAGLYSFLDQTAAAPNPSGYYASVMGSPAPKDFSLPSGADRAAYHKVMLSAEAELRRSPDAAAAKLAALEDEIAQMSWLIRQASPSLTRTNQARIEIASARKELLRVVGPH